MAKLYVDMSRKYGAWTPIKDTYDTRYKHPKRMILCRCKCGKEALIPPTKLVNLGTTSCASCRAKRVHTKHGAAGSGENRTSEYKTWAGIKNRCSNSNDKSFKNYGGRGIKVCDRWLESFENFLADMGPKPSPAHSIDRIDVDGNYEPSNCRWATRAEQSRNKRNLRMITYQDKTQCLADWAEEFGIAYSALLWRLDTGWSVEQALTTPTDKPPEVTANRQVVSHNGRSQTLEDWAKELGVEVYTIVKRLDAGWPVEKALTSALYDKRIIEYNGQSQSIADWSRETGLSIATICTRLKNGWGVEKSLTTPVPPRPPKRPSIEYKGRVQSVGDWARELGIRSDTIARRIERGWSVEDALTKSVETKFHINRSR